MAKKYIDVVGSVTPTESVHVSASMKELAKRKMQELMNEEMKVVKGIFKCFETPGATVNIVVKKYPGTAPFSKVMKDGETYEVPLYVARHLNGIDITAGALSDDAGKHTKIGTCSYPVHGFKWDRGASFPSAHADESGSILPVQGVVKRIQRYGFQSLEFAGAAA